MGPPKGINDCAADATMLNNLRQVFFLLAFAWLIPSASGQTNAIYAWRNLTGQAGGDGDADGMGGTARFFNPSGVAVDGAGNVYVADSGNHTIRKITGNGRVTTLAGSPGQAGSADGTNNAARFNYPSGVAVDSAGNVYVADTYNSTIRKITSSGLVTTLAGSAGQAGSADGTNNTAMFNFPRSVAVDSLGNVYVADSGNNTIRKITSSGVVTTLAGSAGQSGSADGTNNTALFFSPAGVAVDGAGNVFVADVNNNSIRKVTSSGAVTTLAGMPQFDHFGSPIGGSADGTNATARFSYPMGVTVDGTGNIYVADTGNSTIRKVTDIGVVTTIAGSAELVGNADGTNNTARFNYPLDVATDSHGNVFIADFDNSSIRKITGGGMVTTLAGMAEQSGSVDVTGKTARFNNPLGVSVDSAGNIYVTDAGNSTIRKVTSNGVVTTLAGSAGQAGSADGTNNLARFDNPSGVAVDGAGNLYVADAGNNTIRKVTSAGVVTTLAGSAGQSGSTDGTNNLARFSYPFGVTVDSTGNVYATDTFNSTIRKISALGVVTTLAGSAGQFGSADGTGNSARFLAPAGLSVDYAGNIYVADTGNSTLRKITALGVVTTLAGGVGQSGSVDDISSTARYFSPNGVAVDGAGNLYVADTGNSTIRKVTGDGGVTTLAGSAGQTGSTDGTNSTALFNYPSGIAVDSAGNVYVADTYNSTIRKVTTNGVVTTLAGTPGQFGSTDGANTMALFNYPAGVAVDSLGNVYVADAGNNTIRKVTSGGKVSTLAGSAGQSGSADGANGTARFSCPDGVAVDRLGNIYVADSGNNSIRKVTSAGVVTTLAGNAGVFGDMDGNGADARFNFPRGVAVDNLGNLFVADTGNNTIRKVMTNGVVTTIGGADGVIGGADGVGGSANFADPSGISEDGNGRIYVADAGNNRISKGTPLPTLNLTRSATSVIVSWPASFAGFELQQNSDIANANGWSTASYGTSDDGTNNSVTVSLPIGIQFFRLIAN